MFKICVFTTALLAVIATTSAASLNPAARAADNALYSRYVCRNRPDGYKTMVPGSCSSYYQCYNGASVKVDCPAYYDGVKNICVDRNPGCIEDLAKYPAAAKDVSNNPCSGKVSGYVVGQNQAQWYQCNNSNVISSGVCPSGQEYNLVLLQCGVKSSCGGDDQPPCQGQTTTPPPCTTTTTPCTTTTTTCTTTTTTCTTTTTTCSTTPTPTKTVTPTPTKTFTNTDSNSNTNTETNTDTNTDTNTNYLLNFTNTDSNYLLNYTDSNTNSNSLHNNPAPCTTTPAPCTTTPAPCTTTPAPCTTPPPVCPSSLQISNQASAPTYSKPIVQSLRPNTFVRPAQQPTSNMMVLPPQSHESNMDLYMRYVCKGKPNGFMLPSLRSCNEYFICRNEETLKASCGDKFFNSLKGQCDLPENTGCIQPYQQRN
ncbi:unnamed protein product [Ceratitis capitata]|uniref:(Mediterranean fruit fly) hypothetical protein n=1 Tax=Ceratitis capitata TaxID=7213 RepID=A0A811UP48_CERCA|nr:unnamed protein product [Ceratitis capitata]